MQLTQKIMIHPTKEQETILWVLSEKCRLIYNFGLAERKEAYKKHEKISYCIQQNGLTLTKKAYPEYGIVYSKVLQMTLRQLDADYRSFFALKRNGDKTAKSPRFKGKELGARDALEIERAIDEGWIKVAKLTRKQSMNTRRLVAEARIGLGEAEALMLGRDKRMVVILDDKEARALAKSWNLNYTSTLMVLYEAFVKNLISYDELVEDLAKLAKVMWISTDAITEVIKRAKKVTK